MELNGINGINADSMLREKIPNTVDTPMIEFVEEKLKTRRIVYLTDSNIILEDYRKEIEKIDEYNGRQLLEMLQNADDEAVTENDKTCFIELTKNQLTIANNGRKFSEGGIESLMYSNLSPKVLEQNKVGQKGLGFRSILSWANKITIKSYDFAVEFSESNAKEFLESLIKEKPEIESQLREKEKIEKFPIAILRCPKLLETIPDNLLEYDTYIVIDLKDEQTIEVQKQINNEINKEVLLFLNNLERIIVKSPDRNFEIKKDIIGDKAIIQEFNSDSSTCLEKVWNIKSRKGEHKNKNYELKIAWNDDLDDKIGRLYSYFKTNVKFPFPALIHATFDLTSDRNHFSPKSEHNVFLIEELIQLLIETALEISNNEISYKPLMLLSIQGKENFDTFFDDNDFSNKLKNKIRENNIYPTIANEYISYQNNPKYYQNNYAEILPADMFSDLLLFTNNLNVKETISWIGYYTYERISFFSKISTISNKINLEQRAKLISYLTDDFKETVIQKSDLPNIFIDQDNQVIDSDSEIFLPPREERIEIPIKLNLKIINSDLFSILKKIYRAENAEVIEDKLKLFGIKVYRFSEIFRRIVSDFNNNVEAITNKRESIRNLLTNLYELYRLNKDKEGIDINIPSNVSIPILNKNNGETKVSNVYLGKDYGNKLCEVLYEYDKSKIVGSYKILGLEGKENIAEFLIWLGVASYPRKKIINAENDYGYFAIKQFPYKEKYIYGYDVSLNSFKKLEQKGYGLYESKVETVEDLENILKNNSNENILYWFNCDKRITDTIETNPNSLVKLSISNKYYHAQIKNIDLPSYVLWKIKRLEWLKTETGKTAKTTDCCISKTITKEFSPFIEIPKVEYDNYLFKDAKIKKEDVDYFLLKLGVNKEISDFATDTIYSMLTNLQNIDKDGEKAKLIYRELAENLDEKKIDYSSNKYQLFTKEGFVFSKKNGNYSYESVKNVYYIEDKTFGEDIINQFPTIEIDRRKGARKIKALFGVTPLENLEFILNSKPNLHKLNDIFQNEIDTLKPYFYAFRLLKDTDGKELNWIKNSRVTLCTEIKPMYNHHGQQKEFELKPYEFIYIEKRNEVFLLIEDSNKYNTVEDLQSDFKFPDSIAEIFSSIIKVDSHRVSFSRLFEASTEKRNHIIKTELDDKNLEKLINAKKRLNIVYDPKIQFWLSILTTLGKNCEYRKYTDEEFADLIYSSTNIRINEINLDYKDINNSVNSTVIIGLFRELNFNISDYNRNSTIALNIIPYYHENIVQLKNNFQATFETLLYIHLNEKTLNEKERFVDLQLYYEKFNQFKIENNVNIDIKKLFIETIKNEFQIDLFEKHENIDLPEIYKINKTQLFSQIKSLNKTLLTEIIERNNNYRSLLYFAEYETIIQGYNDLEKNTENKKVINFGNNTLEITKNDFEELYYQLMNLDLITKIERINSSKPILSIDNESKSISKSVPRNVYATSDKETIGFIGEIIVVESLKNKYGLENVIWDSGYSRKVNINPKGDDNKHYDIKYRNNHGKWNFVEVKTTTTDKLEFKISSLEVNFGIENKSNYEIMIVTNALGEKKNRKIKTLTNPFKFGNNESFTNNMNFLVINDNYTIRLNEDRASGMDE